MFAMRTARKPGRSQRLFPGAPLDHLVLSGLAPAREATGGNPKLRRDPLPLDLRDGG